MELIARDPFMALHAMAKGFKGGIVRIATLLGRSPGVMHNKFSEACEHSNLTLHEALAIQEITDSDAFAEAVAATRGGIFVKLPELGEAADDDVLADFLALIDKEGVLARTLTEARSDGLIEPHEFDAVRADSERLVAALHRLLADLRTQVRIKPVGPSIVKAA